MAAPTVDLKNRRQAALLAWLVPGLGHYYQGRRGKALLYFLCILGLYFTGFWLGDGKIVYWRWVDPFKNYENFNMYYIAQFFVGLAALPPLIQGTLAHFNFPPILGGFMDPSTEVLNGLQFRLGRFYEVGSIYTAVAGLLNVFAIYDAYAGPAFSDDEEPAANPADEPNAAAVPATELSNP